MNTKEKQGIYIIHCRRNNARYVGKTNMLFSRLRTHFYKLEREEHEIPLLQRDWSLYGKSEFSFHFWPLNSNNLNEWEKYLIIISNAMEHMGGYNKMAGNSHWGPSARIRNTETKLQQAGKFRYINSTCPNDRMNKTYLNTFCQENGPIRLTNHLDVELEPLINNNQVKSALQKLLHREFKVWRP